MRRKLRVTENGRTRELLFVGTMAVGRDPQCDISGSDPLLSRRHAEFASFPDRAVVRDLQSRNGVTVNGQRIAEAILKPGDAVQIAGMRIELVEEPETGAFSRSQNYPLPAEGTPRHITKLHTAAAADAEQHAPQVALPLAPTMPMPVIPSDGPAAVPDASMPPADQIATPASLRATTSASGSLRLRPAAEVAVALDAEVLPPAWTRRVRIIALGLAFIVFAVSALPMVWLSRTLPIVELLAAALFAGVAALMAAQLIERTTLAHLSADDAPGRAAARDADLPLQWRALSEQSVGRAEGPDSSRGGGSVARS